ncbi:MAG: CcmD family protein [Thermoplasmata archaeon]|nr:CcmD family protein [Thermoplasmata archaeon]
MIGVEQFYWAYLIIWAGIVLYVLYLTQRQSKITKEIKLLKEVIDGGRD